MAPLGRLVLLASVGLAAAAVTGGGEVLPPEVEFIGRAPKLRIYPGGKMAQNSTWIMLTFGKIQEFTKDLKAVPERSIQSLAAEKDIIWTQENRVVGGAEAFVTRMELPIVFGGSFKETCRGGSGGGGNLVGGGSNLGGSNLGGAPMYRYVAIEVFIFTEDATLFLGVDRIDVKRGQLKFNIESRGWPFCDYTNSLIFALHLLMPTDGLEGADGERSFAQYESQNGKRDGDNGDEYPKTKRFRARAGGGSDVAMDLPEIAVLDNETENATVTMYPERERTTLLFQFPRFLRSMLYDPVIGFEAEGPLPPSENCSLCGGEVLGDTADGDENSTNGTEDSTTSTTSTTTADPDSAATTTTTTTSTEAATTTTDTDTTTTATTTSSTTEEAPASTNTTTEGDGAGDELEVEAIEANAALQAGAGPLVASLVIGLGYAAW